MKQLIFTLLIASIFLISFSVSVSAEATVYDDFSGPELDLSKWTISTKSTLPNEYFVDTGEEVYHISQPVVVGDTNIHLTMLQGVTNETIEYDLIYNSGSGNHMHNINFAPYPTYWYPSGSNIYIGYWNSPGEWGTQTGTYHITIDFDSALQKADISVERPDSTFWTGVADLSSILPPYHLLMQSGTGHNGIMHFDYDNFVITTDGEEPPEPPNDLEERVAALEEKVEELEDRMTLAEAAITAIYDILNGMTGGLFDQIIGFLSHAPNGIKKQMICGYMEDEGLTEYSALGLDCEIKTNGNCFCK